MDEAVAVAAVTTEAIAEKQFAADAVKENLSNAIAIADDAAKVEIRVHRVSFKDTTDDVVKCRADISLDGGQTWSDKPVAAVKGAKQAQWLFGSFPIGFTAAGGQSVDPQGNPFDYSSVIFPLPPGKGRLIRVTLVALDQITAKVEVIAS